MTWKKTDQRRSKIKVVLEKIAVAKVLVILNKEMFPVIGM